jgi:hypothetical protein
MGQSLQQRANTVGRNLDLLRRTCINEGVDVSSLDDCLYDLLAELVSKYDPYGKIEYILLNINPYKLELISTYSDEFTNLPDLLPIPSEVKEGNFERV